MEGAPRPQRGGVAYTAGMTLVVVGTLVGIAVFMVLALISPILAAIVLLIGLGIALFRRRSRRGV